MTPRARRVGDESPYFLLVGSIFGHKNTETILRAWPLVREECTARRVRPPRLILVGPLPGNHADRLASDRQGGWNRVFGRASRLRERRKASPASTAVAKRSSSRASTKALGCRSSRP